jgi:hypothetical protein
MKKLLTLLLCLLSMPLFAQIAIRAEVSEDEAVDIAKNLFAGRDVDIYIGDYSSADWLVFIDEEPLKGWEHWCTYLYVQKTRLFNTPIRYSQSREKLPPSIDLRPKYVKNRATRAPLNIKVSSNATNTKSYAVILSGGANKNSNHERYWNDCSFIYQTLVNKYLIPKDNIYVIMADGTNPEADMRCVDGTYKSSPLDLDFDGSPDLKYAATKANVSSVFNELSRKLTEENHLFFFVIDHGGSHDGVSQSYINLWGREVLEDYELSTMLNKINAGAMNIVLGQCYSGGFIDNIAKKGRVIATASTGGQSSYACSDLLYDEFVYHWTSAVARRTAYGVSVSSDLDYSGHVTMDEAFTFAEKKDRANETPMYNSTPLSVGEDLAFDKMPNLVDLYIRDNVEDTGKEPNLTAKESWKSPDIWVRNQKDDVEEHENPYYSDEHPTAFVKVRITNRGTKDYKSAEQPQYLHVCWTKASTNISIDAWKGRELYNNYVTGFYIVPTLIREDIPAGKSAVITVTWTLPDYMLDSMSDNDTENHHFCLFARVSKEHTDDIDKELITDHNTADIRGSNKLAQKNLSIIRKGSSNDLTSTVFVRNTMGTSRSYSLEIRTSTEADKDLFTMAQVSVEMSGPIYQAWERGGSNSTGIKRSPSVPRVLQLESASSKISGISLNKNEFEKISLECNFYRSLMIPNRTYTIDLIQRDEATGDIVGGETFIIDPRPLSIISPPIIIRPGIIDGKYQLSAEAPDNTTNYTWTDKAGNIVGNTKEVTVSPTIRNNEYTVTAKAGGILDQASITLDLIQGIKSVTPSPATNYIDVILKEPADNDLTYVKVQSVQDNGRVVEKEVVRNNSQVRIELGTMPRGVILIQLISDNEVIDNAKIIKN